MRRLEGKVCVITGGASGMGRDTALRFLEEGAQVVIGDLNQANGEATLEAAEERGFRDAARFVHCDVSEEADVEGLVGEAVQRFGRLDCMFNNAGIGGAFGPITETDVREWDDTMAILLRGVFLGMKHAARAMQRQSSGGSIISTASVAGLGGGAGPHCYSAAKAGVVNLTRCVAGELAHARIRVNAIAPGAIRTPLFHSGHAEERERQAQAKTPWPRLGTGADIAAAAAFLAANESEFITGQVLVIDGGALAIGPNFWGYEPQDLMLRKAGMAYGSTGRAASVREVRRD